MQSKSTRAFRTISEAGEELGLQPHVLRFWESKFSQIQPMKRSGGRRFYRPEDIELLRGIKILLHREKHPIKDVQKLIRIKGPQSVIDLGRSVERAANPKDIKDTNLVPERIKPVVEAAGEGTARAPVAEVAKPTPKTDQPAEQGSRIVPFKSPAEKPQVQPENFTAPAPAPMPAADTAQAKPSSAGVDREKLQGALARLKSLRSRWEDFEK